MSNGKVNWYKERVIAVTQNKGAEALEAFAMQIVAQAQLIITENDQIDTGFMRASGYWAIRGRSGSYSKIDQEAKLKDKDGRMVMRKAAEEAAIPAEMEGVAGFAAEYAIYQEIQNSFLYKAAQQVAASQVGSGIKVTPL